MFFYLISSVIPIAAAILIVANIVQWKMTGTVRIVGLLIAGAWMFHTGYYLVTGDKLPLHLFFICDALIMGYIAGNIKASIWQDKTILALYMVAWLVYATIQEPVLWWTLWAITLSQFILSMPWPLFQKIKGWTDHGPLREAA